MKAAVEIINRSFERILGLKIRTLGNSGPVVNKAKVQ